MAKDDNTFMKGVQERIGTDKYIRGVGEIDYQRRTGKDDGDTSMFTPEELMRLIAIREKQDAKLKKEIEDKELKEAVTKKQSKGGSMTKQMELFNEGGLKEEGGTVDPVSGNDVPIGSTKEEVRDDIPAQLSEGEFVFPADVVRYIGLEKLMKLRQNAKQGLKAMEDMGQMGNSDEATMPDDLPFDMTDLDIEDEIEYNRGGVVEAQQGTYVAPTVPTQYKNESIDTTSPMGMQQIQSGLNTGVTTQAPYTPNLGQLYAPQTQPYAPVTYTQFLGPSAAGAPQTETVRYFNEATGQTRMIPHVVNPDGSRGATLYPVPEGFVIQEEAPKEEAKKTTATPTAKVQPVESGDDGGEDGSKTSAVDLTGNPLSYTSVFGGDALDKTMSNYSSLQRGLFNLYDAGSRGVSGKINANNAILSAGKIALSDIRGKISTGLNIPTNFDFGKLSTYEGITSKKAQETRDGVSRQLNQNIETIRAAIIDPTTGEVYTNKAFSDALSKYSVKTTVLNKNTNIRSKRNIGEIVTELRDRKLQEVAKFQTDTGVRDEKDPESIKTAQQVAENMKNASNYFAYAGEPIESSYDSSDYDTFTGESGQTVDPSDISDAGGSFAGDDPAFNQGGLAGKKKKAKPKKMKRGGLASR